MNNQRDKFKEVVNRYWKIEKEAREYRRQFFTIVCDGKTIRKATKVLTSEEMRRLKELEEKFDKVRKEYTGALNNLDAGQFNEKL